MRQLVNKLPLHEIYEIISTNRIAKAKPYLDDYDMRMLTITWRAYIEPTVELGCPHCYVRIINNFKEMQPIMIEILKEQQLLTTV